MRIRIVLLLFLLAACQPEPVDTYAPYVPVPEEVEEEEVIEEIEEEIIEEPVEETTVFEHSFDGAISEVICDREARKLTFTFSNPTDLTWQLDRELPWPSPAGMTIVDVVLNDLQVNDPFNAVYNDERMYGPGEKFSENCGGVAELAPGEEVTCSVWPAPINVKKFDVVTNFLIVTATRLNERVQFAC